MLSSQKPITDAYMIEMLDKTKPYTVLILHKTPKRDEPGADAIIREHGRRNFELRRDGKYNKKTPSAEPNIRTRTKESLTA